ncbi:response regulator transcription factor [Celeribacter sp.]|uniref:response regulator transcription factor n=1 Tax=Celeribacter sp. TaxID=1890673 RepID=UPI003A904A61
MNPLSPRQLEVLEFLALGYQYSEIANELGISVSAVSLYLKNARHKLNARTKEQCLAIAVSEGWVSAPTRTARERKPRRK